MQGNSQASFSKRQRWVIGANVVTSILALAALVLMANYLAARHFRRVPWNTPAVSQLSPVTGRVLDSVTNEIKVIAFYDRSQPLYGAVSDLLELYQLRCPQIQVEYLDYVRYRDRAKLVQDQYKLDPNQEADRIIFAANGRHRIVYAKDLAEFDVSGALQGQEVRRTGFRGEQLFTSAIFSLVDPEPRIAYYLMGHGVHDPTQQGSDGYATFAQVLAENHILLQPYLARSDVPSDCQLLIVAGPQTGLLPSDIDRLSAYLNRGGRMLLLFRTLPYQRTGLERLLSEWGVEIGNNFVLDPRQQKAGEENLVLVNRFGSHPVSDPLRRSALALVQPRSIRPKASNGQSANAPKVVELATTSEQGQACVIDDSNRARTAFTGAIPLAVAVEKGSIQGISSDRGATRMVVVGDSALLGNALIQVEGNRDFARNAVNWLLSRESLLEGIGPRPIEEYRITMTRAEMQLLLWLFLGAAPGAAFCIAGIVWLRRRS